MFIQKLMHSGFPADGNSYNGAASSTFNSSETPPIAATNPSAKSFAWANFSSKNKPGYSTACSIDTLKNTSGNFRIICAGVFKSSETGSTKLVMAQFKQTGKFDTAFNGMGKASITFPGFNNYHCSKVLAHMNSNGNQEYFVVGVVSNSPYRTKATVSGEFEVPDSCYKEISYDNSGLAGYVRPPAAGLNILDEACASRARFQFFAEKALSKEVLSRTIVVTKLNRNGVLDSNFGVNGTAYFPQQNISTLDADLTSDGSIIVLVDTGERQENGKLLKFSNEARGLDLNFGTNGIKDIRPNFLVGRLQAVTYSSIAVDKFRTRTNVGNERLDGSSTTNHIYLSGTVTMRGDKEAGFFCRLKRTGSNFSGSRVGWARTADDVGADKSYRLLLDDVLGDQPFGDDEDASYPFIVVAGARSRGKLSLHRFFSFGWLDRDRSDEGDQEAFSFRGYIESPEGNDFASPSDESDYGFKISAIHAHENTYYVCGSKRDFGLFVARFKNEPSVGDDGDLRGATEFDNDFHGLNNMRAGINRGLEKLTTLPTTFVISQVKTDDKGAVYMCWKNSVVSSIAGI